MNTKSHYKQKLSMNNRKKTKDKIVIKQNDNNLHIKLDTPIIDPTSDCFNYSYDITTSINTDLTKINPSINKVSFCIYRIVHCKNQQNVKHPFLQYLLYKYPPTQGNISNTMIFPFIKIKNNIKNEPNKFIKTIIGKDLKPEGFIEKNKTVFLFYNINSVEDEYIDKVNFMTKQNELWWCIMDEICNHKKVLKFPIHKSVYTLFYNNPSLIYIKLNEKRIEIPIVAYYGNYFNFLPIVAALGQRANTSKSKSDSLFFSSFKKAIRYGCWTEDYKKKTVYNEDISDIDGLYHKCGIIRFALFIGNIDIINSIEVNKLEKYITSRIWKTKFNSIFLTKLKFDEKELDIIPEYILKDFSQQTPLSYHEIDKNTLPPVWEPNFSDYNIV